VTSGKGGGRHWPFILGGLLLLTACANLLLVSRALNNESFSVEPDYYEKAMAHDEVMAQERRNQQLGWQLDLTTDGAHLEVDLRDADGARLRGASVSVAAFHRARGNRVRRADFTERQGAYHADLGARRPGRWELRFVVTLGDARFTRTMTHQIWPHRGGSGEDAQ